MTKYIWITIIVLGLVLILAWKQAGKEPEAAPPASETQHQEAPPVSASATATTVPITLPIAP